jgi:hypothetical protein
VSSALPFGSMSVDSFAHLETPALTLLGDLDDQAVQAGGPGPSQAVFISGALRELSVALCRGNDPCLCLAIMLRREPLAGPRCAALPGPRLKWFRPALTPCVGLGFLVWLRFALCRLTLWRVCAIAPSFVSS